MLCRKLILVLAVSIFGVGCSTDKENLTPTEPGYALEYPSYFPKIHIPEDNKLTKARVELGKMLFFDPILSRDSTISCASCHKPHLAFSDDKPVSPGVEGRLGARNAMPLFNLAFQNKFGWDGGTTSLETQILVPIQDHNEMDFTFPALVERLNKHKDYPRLFQAAYNRKPDNFSIVRAVSAYERTLISGNSKYDRFLSGDKSVFNASELRGYNIFFGETAECHHCHTAILLTDHNFENNGLKSDSEMTDTGREQITDNPADRGKMRVPTLRNIELTAPYMHDGSIPTLERVVEHYMSGGKPSQTKSGLIRPFYLTPQEREDLVAFMKTLTDISFVNQHKP